MPHFAQLNPFGTVLTVVVVGDKDCADEHGNEIESVGIEFCKSLFGEDTVWKQTSINSRIRNKYAEIGDTYYKNFDAFISPQPYADWILNIDTYQWEPPTPKPSNPENDYRWDETAHSWVAIQPFPSWVFDAVSNVYKPPVPYPTGPDSGDYYWDETSGAFIKS